VFTSCFPQSLLCGGLLHWGIAATNPGWCSNPSLSNCTCGGRRVGFQMIYATWEAAHESGVTTSSPPARAHWRRYCLLSTHHTALMKPPHYPPEGEGGGMGAHLGVAEAGRKLGGSWGRRCPPYTHHTGPTNPGDMHQREHGGTWALRKREAEV